jgi:hypothetical protein
VKIKDLQLKVASFGPDYGYTNFVLSTTDDSGSGPKFTYDNFTKLVSKNKWDDKLEKLLDGSTRMHLTFKGGDVELQGNQAEFDKFIEALDHASGEMQRALIVPKMRPPFRAWMGKPTTFTGMRHMLGSFYENFNCSLAIADASCAEIPLMEVMNASMGAMIVKAKAPGDLMFLEGKRVVPMKVYVVDQNEAPSDELIDICSKNFFRYNYGLRGDRFFD